MSRAARATATRRREALATAHARIEALRADPALREEALEREYARRSLLYVLLSTILLGHLALVATRMPSELRVLSGGVLLAGILLWRESRKRAPARGRRSAWAGWAVACLAGTLGIVVSRHNATLAVVIPAALYGLGTFALGCALAADARRFEDCEGTRWLVVILLGIVLLGLHQELLQTSWGGDHG